MFDYIQGNVVAVQEGSLVVDLGMVGLSVQVPLSGVYTIGSKVKIHVHMHWNQEQGPSLYGFATELEKTIFLLITSCSGLGPKIGLAVLAGIGAEQFLRAVQTGDEKLLSSVSGIGVKKAEQMIVQLKHKVAKLIKSGVALDKAEGAIEWQQVSDVLSSLNYSRAEINSAMSYLSKNCKDQSVPFDGLIRQALSFLAKKA